MRYLLPLFVLLLAVQLLPAQNWAPINTTDKYNYKADTATAISHTLWVDSVGFDGTDSVYYPNKIVKHFPDSINGPYYGKALKNQPQFLNKQVAVQAGGLYLFSEPTTISYYSWANVNDSYTYDSTENITATVLALEEATVLGSLDSVKTILLSSGDTIIASKNHGFVQYPMEYGSGKYYRLAGIEGGRNLGEHVAKFEDFFNYAVGDSFWYYMDHFNIFFMEEPRPSRVLKAKFAVTIDSLFYLGDTIGLSKNGLDRYPSPIGGSPYLVNFSLVDVNIYPNTIIVDSMNYADNGNGEFAMGIIKKEFFYNIPYLSMTENSLSYAWGGNNFFRGYSSYLDSLGNVVKVFNKHYTQNPAMGDTLYYQLASQGTRAFVSRLGLVNIETNAFESGARTIMYAYRLAGDSAVTILSQEYYDLVIGIEEANTLTTFNLLGNPVSNSINIQLETQQPHTLTLYNLSGQQLLQQQTQETNTTMDVSHLPQGVYLLEVRNAGGISRQRVVKM